MILKGVNNQTVELKIINYQFPEITNCKYDSNWLLVDLKVNSGCGNWQTLDPSLLVQDIKNIIQWLENLLNNIDINGDSLAFIEPNLEFKLIKQESFLKTVRLIFNSEFAPQQTNDEMEYYVDCQLNPAELKKIIEELKNELQAFPERGL